MKHTHFKSAVLDEFWTNACTCFTTTGLLLLLLLLHCSIQIEILFIVLKSSFMIQSLTLFWKEILKTIFFSFLIYGSTPTHSCLLFFPFDFCCSSSLSVCRIQTGSCLLALLTRQRGISLLFFYFVLSDLSHILWNLHPSIHATPHHPPIHWSLPYTPSYPSIQLFVECLPWAMGHQESNLHLISVLTGKPDNLTTMLRKPYIGSMGHNGWHSRSGWEWFLERGRH